MRLIDKTDYKDVSIAALLLRAAYTEVYKDATRDISRYEEYIVNEEADEYRDVWVSDRSEAILVVQDVTPKLRDTANPVFDVVSMYIMPHKRNKLLWKDMKDTIYKEYGHGSIIGFTEKHSENVKVLGKRAILRGYIYEAKPEVN